MNTDSAASNAETSLSAPTTAGTASSVDCSPLWRAGTRELRVFRGHHDPIWAVAYQPSGTMVALVTGLMVGFLLLNWLSSKVCPVVGVGPAIM